MIYPESFPFPPAKPIGTHLLHPGPYTLSEIAGELGVDDILSLFPDRADAASLVISRNTDFYLRERVQHVLEEANRVQKFKVSWCCDTSICLSKAIILHLT